MKISKFAAVNQTVNSMKHILVTGCRGQLGNELQQAVRQQQEAYRIFFTDKEELDICDPNAVAEYIKSNSIQTVINCAAFTAVDKAESETELCDLLNHKAPGYLAEAIAAVGGEMVQISTDYVFDGSGHTPYSEEAPTNPNSVYGRTKLAGEEAVIRHCHKSMIIRTAWLYSTYGNNFVKTMIRLGKEREQLGVVFDQIGSPTYARDLARAILVIIEKGIIPGIYHYTNEGVCSWYDFTRTIHRLAGISKCQVKPIHTDEYPAPAPRPHYSVLDKNKIKNAYGIDIPWWEESLQECIQQLANS